MVVLLNEDSYDGCLDASPEKSVQFLRQYPANRLVAVAEPRQAAPNFFETA